MDASNPWASLSGYRSTSPLSATIMAQTISPQRTQRSQRFKSDVVLCALCVLCGKTQLAALWLARRSWACQPEAGLPAGGWLRPPCRVGKWSVNPALCSSSGGRSPSHGAVNSRHAGPSASDGQSRRVCQLPPGFLSAHLRRPGRTPPVARHFGGKKFPG